MEWEKAKNLILLFFVLLNQALGGLLFLESRRYTVTPEREQVITAIMNQNNISKDTRLIRRFPPMRAINVAGFYYNLDDLISAFFGDATDVRHITTPHGHIISYGPAELIIDHGFISYDNPEGHGGPWSTLPDLDKTSAQRLTDAFVRSNWPSFQLDDVLEGNGWLRLSYREVYRGYIIHSNFIEFIVTEVGIVQVDMQFSRVLEWYGPEQPIAAPDEVLLTFVQRVRGIATVTPIVITHMDLVFFQEEGSTDPYARYHRVEPFYRVFIGGDGSDPFLINAFTNEIIN